MVDQCEDIYGDVKDDTVVKQTATKVAIIRRKKNLPS